MASVLAHCNQPLASTYSTAPAAQAPVVAILSPVGANPAVPAPIAPETPAPAPAAVHYANCAAARAAGSAPLYAGQTGYRPALDGDADGIACEG